MTAIYHISHKKMALEVVPVGITNQPTFIKFNRDKRSHLILALILRFNNNLSCYLLFSMLTFLMSIAFQKKYFIIDKPM